MQPEWWEVLLHNVGFQSMHPIKDATDMEELGYTTAYISIHAPYKGCNNELFL